MKACPHCRIKVGGDAEYCPVCQNPLTGRGGEPRFPATAPNARRASLLYKFIAFLLLAAAVVCAAVDFLLVEQPHRHWSIAVSVCVAATLVFLRALMRPRYNAPKLLFQLLVQASVLAVFLDLFLGFSWVSVDVVVPVLCSVALVLNFIFSFINSRLTENALVYLLLNIVVGVAPYPLLALRGHTGAVAWVVCLIVGIITFLGLLIFRWRTLWSELHKRLHM